MWGVTLGAKDIGALAASTGESTLFSLEMLKTSLGEHLAKMLEKKSRVCDGNDLELFLSLQISNFPFSPPLTPLPQPSGEQSLEATLFVYEGTFEPLCHTSMKKHEQGRKGRYNLRCIMNCILLWASGIHPLWDLWGAYIMRFRISYSRDEKESHYGYILQFHPLPANYKSCHTGSRLPCTSSSCTSRWWVNSWVERSHRCGSCGKLISG